LPGFEGQEGWEWRGQEGWDWRVKRDGWIEGSVGMVGLEGRLDWRTSGEGTDWKASEDET
jgi:hypothetical protein